MIEFVRDGHIDAILVRRFQQTAGVLHYSADGWKLRQCGGAVIHAGSVQTHLGRQPGYAPSKGWLACFDPLVDKTWGTLRDAIQAISDADPKTPKTDRAAEAARLLTNFRKYTANKLAA